MGNYSRVRISLPPNILLKIKNNMLDPFLFKKNFTEILKRLKNRNFNLDEKKYLLLEKKRKLLQIKTESLQFQYKKSIKNSKNKKFFDKDITLLKKNIEILNKELTFLKKEIHDYMSIIPNLPEEDVPIGKNDSDNKIIRYWGKIRKMNFKIRNHIELGKLKNKIDFSSGSKITGSKFVILKGKFAMLHRALSNFMLDLHTEKHGYEEISVPYLVNQDSLYGTGQIPKFSKDLFHIKEFSTKNVTNYYSLIPTSEVPLTNLVRNTILEEKNLPIKMISCTPCFRKEAGSYGRSTKGLIRMHQFDKVELVHISHPHFSSISLDEIVQHAEKVLQLLKLPYRKVILCTGVMNFSAAKTYDLEVWLPSQNNYKEISSCSNMKDFQARRMKAKYRDKNSKKTKLVHTLNGSGLAIGRTLVAILENYQEEDGKITIPQVLKPYMKKLSYIK